MAITTRTFPGFTLTHSTPATVIRRTYAMVKGRRQSTGETPHTIEANIQPMQFKEVMQMPEADRTKEWYVIYVRYNRAEFTTVSDDLLRTEFEGDTGWDADIVQLDGAEYKVMKCRKWAMGVLDHYEAYAVKMRTTAGVQE